MRLSDWIENEEITRVEFARRIGASPARLTFLCSDDGWPAKRAMAERIREVTRGAVTPNDFLPPAKPKRK